MCGCGCLCVCVCFVLFKIRVLLWSWTHFVDQAGFGCYRPADLPDFVLGLSGVTTTPDFSMTPRKCSAIFFVIRIDVRVNVNVEAAGGRDRVSEILPFNPY